MGRFFLGFLTPLVLAILVGLGIWGSDLFGFLDMETLVLEWTGRLLNLENLAENYEVGRGQTDFLRQMEARLQERETRLRVREGQLEERAAALEQAELRNQRAAEALAQTQREASTATVEASQALDGETKKYLAMVGGMKPEKAAAVLQGLPQETAYLILTQLRASQSSKILENLPAEYVIALTEKRVNK